MLRGNRMNEQILANIVLKGISTVRGRWDANPDPLLPTQVKRFIEAVEIR